MKHLFVPLVVVVLAGCATQAQQQYQLMISNLQRADANSEACSASVNATPAGWLVQKRFIIDRDDPWAVKKITINETPTPEEKEAIITLFAANRLCRKQALEDYNLVHPAYVAYLVGYFAEEDQVAAQVLADEITIGEANRRMRYRFATGASDWQRLGQEITVQLNQSHAYELEQRQRVAAALKAWSYQQQQLNQQQQHLINALNRPVSTNCYYVGNFLRCTSY